MTHQHLVERAPESRRLVGFLHHAAHDRADGADDPIPALHTEHVAVDREVSANCHLPT
jgi:hypothetical protein